ncbi:MAG: hypothetical protein MAG794_01420 [Gammaproteobacteria bacterium]|nr:hypothetical protein [Gammaproteobacteria bacterium]
MQVAGPARLRAAGAIDILAARCPRAHEHGVVALVEQPLHGLHRRVEPEIDAHVDDIVYLLVQDTGRQSKAGDVRTHQAAGDIQLFEDRHRIPQRHQVVGHRQRSAAGADTGDPFAVLLHRDLRQPNLDVILVVVGDALEPADGHRFLAIHAAPPAGRLTGTVADPTQDAREYIVIPVQHVGVGIPALSD